MSNPGEKYNAQDRRLAELIGEEWCWREFQSGDCMTCPKANTTDCVSEESCPLRPLPFTTSWDACGEALDHYERTHSHAGLVCLVSGVKPSCVSDTPLTERITAALVAALEGRK